MKKVMFLQIKGKNYAGVWQVNKLVGEELIKKGYDVSVVSLRDNQNNLELEHDEKLKLYTINKKDIWETYQLSDILNEYKKIKLKSATKKMASRIKHDIILKRDVNKLKKYITKENPDYIITTHYQLLDMIPKKMLNKTIHEQHSSFLNAINHKATRKTLYKYNDKIKYLWLTKTTMNEAIKKGLSNNYYIYNAVRIKSDKISNVLENKKLITVARLSKEKRIDLMIKIVEKIFAEERFKDWTLEIYGQGCEYDYLKSIIKSKQIKLMGLTDDPKSAYLKSSINLNTSSTEGFSLSILEANECGVPTVTFDFGESVNEEIINKKTGIIALTEKEYTKELKELMTNEEKLLEYSKECKNFSKDFQIENIINEWTKLFDEIEKENNKNSK